MTCQQDPSVSSPLSSVDEALVVVLGAPRDPDARHSGVETDSAPVLEVAQLWRDTVIDVRHLAAAPRGASSALTVGAATGYRWRLLGVPLGWVGPRFAQLAWLAAPALSEASPEARADLFVPAEHLPHDEFPLVRWEAGEALITVHEAWTGWRETSGVRTPLGQSGSRPAGQGLRDLVLQPGEQVLIELGEVRFLIRQAAPGARVAGRFSKEVDLPFAGIMSFTGFLALILGGVIATSPPPVQQTVVDIPDRITELILSVPPPAPEPEPVSQAATRPDAGAGKKAVKEEGKAGRDKGKRTARGGPDLEKRRMDKEIAEDAGVLGALADAGALGGVFDAGVNDQLTAGIGGLHGAVGVQLGTGYGQLGRGPGGGGNEIGSFHGTGTEGLSSGTSGDFSGGGDIGPKREGGVRTSGNPIIIGGLDKGVIDGVIKRHMASFRFCYQRALTRQPDLAGKVSMQFVIAKDGSVSRAKVKSSSLGDAAVESCMGERFLRLRFPEPAGGGIVIVTYPFMFSRQ